MRLDEAVELIRPAVPAGGIWADFGAGTGLFTLALAELLNPAASVVAVDQDPRALAALEQSAHSGGEARARVTTVVGDFMALDSIPQLAEASLDGALFANALHFAPDAGRVLADVRVRLATGGRVVVVEYDGRPANRWVPHPVPLRRLQELATGVGLRAPRVVGERPSAYGGVMYCAVLERQG